MFEPDTPYAVLCPKHGKVVLTGEQYDEQMNQPDSLWVCPDCGERAEWDDDHHESWYEDNPENGDDQ
jgi:hypothetical protein